MICSFNVSQMTETFGWLVTYFQQLRTSTSDLMNFGLYPQWKPYVHCLSVFLDHLVAEATVVLVTMVTEGLVSPEHGRWFEGGKLANNIMNKYSDHAFFVLMEVLPLVNFFNGTLLGDLSVADAVVSPYRSLCISICSVVLLQVQHYSGDVGLCSYRIPARLPSFAQITPHSAVYF